MCTCVCVPDVTTHAKNYVECIYTLAQSAQVCKGATSEIGECIMSFFFSSFMWFNFISGIEDTFVVVGDQSIT